MIGQLFASFLEDGVLYQHFDRKMSFTFPEYKPAQQEVARSPPARAEANGEATTTPTKQLTQPTLALRGSSLEGTRLNNETKKTANEQEGIGSLLQLLGSTSQPIASNRRSPMPPMLSVSRMGTSSFVSPHGFLAEDMYSAQTINLEAALLMLETLRCPSNGAALAAAANLGSTFNGSMHEASYAYSLAGPSGTPSPTVLGSRWYAGVGNGSVPNITPLQTPINVNANVPPSTLLHQTLVQPPVQPPSTPIPIVPPQPWVIERHCHIPDVSASTIQTLIPPEGLALYAFEPPALPLADYIDHLIAHMPCDLECFVLALALVLDASKVEEEEPEGREASRSYFDGPASDAFDRCPSPSHYGGTSINTGALNLSRRVSISPAKPGGTNRMGAKVPSSAHLQQHRDKASMDSSALVESTAQMAPIEGANESFTIVAVLSTTTNEGLAGGKTGEAEVITPLPRQMRSMTEGPPLMADRSAEDNKYPTTSSSHLDPMVDWIEAADIPCVEVLSTHYDGEEDAISAPCTVTSDPSFQDEPIKPKKSIILSSSLSFVGCADDEITGGPITALEVRGAQNGEEDGRCMFFDEDSDDGQESQNTGGSASTAEGGQSSAVGAPSAKAPVGRKDPVDTSPTKETQPSRPAIPTKSTLKRKRRPKTKNEETNPNNYLLLCTRSVHRVFLAALLVCIKVRNDRSSRMSSYSAIGGLAASDLRAMEIAFLGVLNFDARISVGYYMDLLYSLRTHCTNLVYERQEEWAAAAWGGLFKRLPMPSVASLTAEVTAINEQASIERHRFQVAKYNEELRIYQLSKGSGVASQQLENQRASTPSPHLAPIAIAGVPSADWDPQDVGLSPDEDMAHAESLTLRNDTVAAIIGEASSSAGEGIVGVTTKPAFVLPPQPIDTFLPVPTPNLQATATPTVAANPFSTTPQDVWDSTSTVSCSSSAAGGAGSGGTEAPRSEVTTFASVQDNIAECGMDAQLSPPTVGHGIGKSSAGATKS